MTKPGERMNGWRDEKAVLGTTHRAIINSKQNFKQSPLEYFSLIFFVFIQWSMLGFIEASCNKS